MSKNLYETFEKSQIGTKDKVTQRSIEGRRGARLTLTHLLKLREIRERKKLRRLKDMKLYHIMYNSDDGGGGGGMGF